MHIHMPRPLHGWREFLHEVIVIVVGVLIALAGESLVERWHWREQRVQAASAIAAELRDAAISAQERLSIQPCLRGRIAQLAGWLLKSRTHPQPLSPARGSASDVLPSAYAPPTRVLAMDAWQNVTRTPLVSHMAKEQNQLSAVYSMIEQWNEHQREEQQAAVQLSPELFFGRLNDAQRSEAWKALGVVDRLNSLLARDSRVLLRMMRYRNLGPSEGELAHDPRANGADLVYARCRVGGSPRIRF
jgi:hypothetical protein